MTSHTLYMTLHTWEHKSYICHLTLYICTTSTVSVSSNLVYQLYYTHSQYDITHYMYEITFTMHDITWTLYGITTVHVWHHIQYIYDIIFNIYDITHTVPLKQNDYTCYLTHCIWHHSHCICVATPALSMPSQQLWKYSHLAYVWHHTHPASHQIQTLWHPSSVFRTSQTLHTWHQISYLWHHIHGLWHLIPYTCDITATILQT